jgi:flavin reductase (DIM6/NTAB) family NADH-FMN oxidoreductase RutF
MSVASTTDFDSREFRRILGHYPTGVCAITTMSEGRPLGIIVGSFTSASLDPPLVAFLPARASRSWPGIEAAGRFCVNVLAADQEDLCRALSSKAENRFDAVSHRLSRAGLPIIEGVVAWIECELFAVHDAGDHLIVLGKVHELGLEHADRPLLFFQGDYGHFHPLQKITENAAPFD